MNSLKWSQAERFKFLVSYVYFRIAILWEVRSPRWTFLRFELGYFWIKIKNRFFGTDIRSYPYSGPTLVETSRGRFRIRSESHDATIVSPAYERRDIDFLISLIRDLQGKRKPVAFLDVGANIGAFTVAVASGVKHDGLQVLAVEPVPGNIALLKENLFLNKLGEQVVTVLPFGFSNADKTLNIFFDEAKGGDSYIGSAASESSKAIQIQLRRGDDVLTSLPGDLIIKIDVEGHEIEAIEGMSQVIARAQSCWICIEDASREEIFDFLRQQGFVQTRKLTPYNSWWLRTAGD